MSKQVTEKPSVSPICRRVVRLPARPLPNSKSGPTTRPLAPRPRTRTSRTKSGAVRAAISASNGSANIASTPSSASRRALVRSGVRRMDWGDGRKNSAGCGSKASTASGASRASASAFAAVIRASWPRCTPSKLPMATTAPLSACGTSWKWRKIRACLDFSAFWALFFRGALGRHHRGLAVHHDLALHGADAMHHHFAALADLLDGASGDHRVADAHRAFEG